MKKYAPYQKAEQQVMKALELHGWQILESNYRGKGFEIDLIAKKQHSIIFVEVKLRKGHISTAHQLSNLMTHRKKLAMYRGSQHYLNKQEKCPKKIRFDLAVVNHESRIQYLVNVYTGMEIRRWY